VTPQSELATLCGACGLCCDGSLFGRVDLVPEEVEPARRNRLHVLDDGRAFEQPCSALAVVGGGRRECSIYGERPLACRRFMCRLYDRHRREGGPLEPRLAAVRRVRELAADLEASGLSPGDFEGEPSKVDGGGREGSLARRAFAELTRRLEEDFARA
jgi:hypothetical protein